MMINSASRTKINHRTTTATVLFYYYYYNHRDNTEADTRERTVGEVFTTVAAFTGIRT